MQTVTREQLLALDNFAILHQAAAAGMTVREEDLFVNYAEIDLELEKKEDRMVQETKTQISAAVGSWIEKAEDLRDLDPEESGLAEILHKQILAHVKSVWSYGSKEAEKELKRMEFAKNGETDLISLFAAGTGIIGDDSTDDDAFEWYDQYTRKLAATAQQDLYIRCQPLILEALDKGMVGQALTQMIMDNFARYGEARADIIARTESSKAFNWGRRSRFDQSAALAGYRYSAIMDQRTTEICKALHDASWEKGNPDLDHNTPPNHFRCRSILVPIHKYKDWTFRDPDLSNLSPKDLEMLEKFKDADFYPKPSTVRPDATASPQKKAAATKKKKAASATPAAAPPAPPAPPAPKPKAAPKKKAAAADPGDPGIPLNVTLTAEDKKAVENFRKLADGLKIGDDPKHRKKVMEELASRIGLDKGIVKSTKGSSAGHVAWRMGAKGEINVMEFAYKQDDNSHDPSKWSTMLHEFYHLNYAGLITDRNKIGADNWVRIEETFTEVTSKYMMKLLGLNDSAALSYPAHLMDTLPKLRRLPEFKECKTLDDFGAKMLKYRFGDTSKTAQWEPIYDQLKGMSINKNNYYEHYRDYVMANKEEITQQIYDGIYHPKTKALGETRLKQIISQGIDDGWKVMKNTNGEIWEQSVICAVRALGIGYKKTQ